MFVYIIMLLLTYIFALLSRITNRGDQYILDNKSILYKKHNTLELTISKVSLLLSFFSIWVVAGLRVNVGTDFHEYRTLFYNFYDLSFNSTVNIELFYFYLNKLIGLFTQNPQWLFIISAFIIYIFYYQVIVKECNYIELAVFLFISFGFYFSSFNILRQWIACAIIFYAFLFLFNKQLIRFLIATIIASLFHITAIIVIPLYFLIRKLRKNTTRILIMLCATIISFMPNFILNNINNVLISINFNQKYFKYIDESASSGAFTYPLFCLIVFFGYFLVRYKIVEINKNSEFHINILTVAFVISILGQNLLIFARLHFYFLPILIIIIPNIIEAFKRETKIIAYFSVLILGFVFMIYILNHNGGEPLPYISIFN